MQKLLGLNNFALSKLDIVNNQNNTVSQTDDFQKQKQKIQ